MTRTEAACVRCENEIDLYAIQGAPYCSSCRACPHHLTIAALPCSKCLLNCHSVWTFSTGPVLVDLPLYVFKAVLFDVNIHTWNIREEDIVGRLYRTAMSAVETLTYRKRAEYMQPPFPLLHLMSTRISSW